jgi:hypothetical protein
MKTITVEGVTIVLAHIVSFQLSDEELARDNRGLVLRIRLSNREEILVSGDELSPTYALLRKAFGVRRAKSSRL